MLKKLEQCCDPTTDVHVMLQNFMCLSQDKGKSTTAFITRLEGAVHRIRTKHPHELTKEATKKIP